MSGLRPVTDDQQLAVLRVLADRRRSLGEDHSRMISQLHRLLLELIPGGAKKAPSAAHASASLSRVRPRDAAGKARRRAATELISDLERIYKRKKVSSTSAERQPATPAPPQLPRGQRSTAHRRGRATGGRIGRRSRVHGTHAAARISVPLQ